MSLLPAVLVMAVVATAPRPHVPDLAPPPVLQPVPIEYRIDCGPWAARACCQITLKKGETLASIAKDRLGSADRATELLWLNPALDAEKVKPGDVIWLPPKELPKSGEERLFAYLVPAAGKVCIPLAEGFSAANGPRDFTIALVPQSSVAAFLKLFPGDAKKIASAIQEMADQQAIVLFSLPFPFTGDVDSFFSRGHTAVGMVQSGSDAVRAVVTLTLKQGPSAQATSVEIVRQEYFDKDGKPASQHAPRPKRKLFWFLLLLGAIGGGGLLALRRLRAGGSAQIAVA